MSIRLLKPSVQYAEEIRRFREEVQASDDKDKFAGCAGLQRYDSVQAWLDSLDRRPEKTDKVPSDVYIAVREEDGVVVGMIDVRHHIRHPVLSTWGGHIGYSVRPGERRRGYAKEMLRQALDRCRALGLDRVLVTCSPDNCGSEKTILANGGVYECTVPADGGFAKRYWITL